MVLISLLASVASCHRIDDHRLPPVAVNIVFTTPGMWTTYGVGGPTDTREFIRTSTMVIPAGFPYSVASATGFGGVLLAVDYNNMPVAYDLSCPYEAKANVRIKVDTEHLDARCPVCGSTYDIFGGMGRPLSGPAARNGYGLTRYRVLNGDDLNFRVITR